MISGPSVIPGRGRASGCEPGISAARAEGGGVALLGAFLDGQIGAPIGALVSALASAFVLAPWRRHPAPRLDFPPKAGVQAGGGGDRGGPRFGGEIEGRWPGQGKGVGRRAERELAETQGGVTVTGGPRRSGRLSDGLPGAALLITALALTLFFAQPVAAAEPVPITPSLPAGVAIGHAEMAGRPTGCTVVLFETDAVAGVEVRGGGPGGRELGLLSPMNPTRRIQAIALSGGSAYGLDVATGVQRWLRERDRGFPTPAGPVALVPQSILYDLPVGDPAIVPDADCGYRAVASTSFEGPWAEGSVGAGAGATVGKMLGLGPDASMKGGLGIAGLTVASGLSVGAVIAVNALGDIIDPATDRVVAGALKDGAPVDIRALIRAGALWNEARQPGQNTTIGVVLTNADLTAARATKLAQMAHQGLARAIAPVATPYDGDTLYAASTGRWEGIVDMAVLGELAAQVVTAAVLRAVCEAEPRLGWITARQLGRCG